MSPGENGPSTGWVKVACWTFESTSVSNGAAVGFSDRASKSFSAFAGKVDDVAASGIKGLVLTVADGVVSDVSVFTINGFSWLSWAAGVRLCLDRSFGRCPSSRSFGDVFLDGFVNLELAKIDSLHRLGDLAAERTPNFTTRRLDFFFSSARADWVFP